jgi:ubiquinone/menaquinone biosynthesis C-methylase UbiE
MKLNLGCGTHVIAGWVNVDYAVGARLAKVPFFDALNGRLKLFRLDWDKRIYLHDLRRPFPWSDESAEAIYSSHTLEHFTKKAGHRFLSECHRVLRRGGIIRIVVPDLDRIVRKYVEGDLAADDFVERLGVLYQERSGARKALSPFVQFPHQCMYDEQRLSEILSGLGFTISRKAEFESDICEIRSIEQTDRARNALIVEGRKN